jgi:mRNA-degrading endonuclease toxin of MazEF toxin-antitoxin module
MSIEQGDVHVVDLGDGVRLRVVVLSDERFTRASGRAIVAPALEPVDSEVLDPWRVRSGGDVFALDLLRTLSVDRLLDRVDRVPAPAVERMRRAIRHIT